MTGADTSRAWRSSAPRRSRTTFLVFARRGAAGCELMAVVKADAYGHSASAIVPRLLSLGVRSFAAATLDEGSQLRALGAEGTVLILGCTSPQRTGELARLGLTQTVADLAHAEALNAQRRAALRHLKIDTGMHRLGIAWTRRRRRARCFAWKISRWTGYIRISAAPTVSRRAMFRSHASRSAGFMR